MNFEEKRFQFIFPINLNTYQGIREIIRIVNHIDQLQNFIKKVKLYTHLRIKQNARCSALILQLLTQVIDILFIKLQKYARQNVFLEIVNIFFQKIIQQIISKLNEQNQSGLNIQMIGLNFIYKLLTYKIKNSKIGKQMELPDNLKLEVYSFFNMNYNFLVISNLSRNDRQLASNVKNMTSANSFKRNFRLYLEEIPDIMSGLKYVHEFSNEFTIVFDHNQGFQHQAFYDYFVQTMAQSIGSNVKISFQVKQKSCENLYSLKSIDIWQKKNLKAKCFKKFIFFKSNTNGFKSLQKSIDNFQVIEFKNCFIGGQTLFELYSQYFDNFKAGNTQECNQIEIQFFDQKEIKSKFLLIKELKLKDSVIFDSQMLMQFTDIEKLTIVNTNVNTFSLKVIENYKNITQLKLINRYYPNTNQLTTEQLKNFTDDLSYINLIGFKNLQKLSFYIDCSQQRIELKQTLEDNFQIPLYFTLFCDEEDITLSEICEYAFFKPNFNVQFVTSHLTLIEMNKFPQLTMNQLQKLMNEKKNLEVVQEIFSQIEIKITQLPIHHNKYSRNSIFSVRIEKNEQIQNEYGLNMIQLYYELFLADYYNKETKLVFYKKT